MRYYVNITMTIINFVVDNRKHSMNTQRRSLTMARNVAQGVTLTINIFTHIKPNKESVCFFSLNKVVLP